MTVISRRRKRKWGRDRRGSTLKIKLVSLLLLLTPSCSRSNEEKTVLTMLVPGQIQTVSQCQLRTCVCRRY